MKKMDVVKSRVSGLMAVWVKGSLVEVNLNLVPVGVDGAGRSIHIKEEMVGRSLNGRV